MECTFLQKTLSRGTNMKLDPDTILTKTFSHKTFGGYDKTEVMDFLRSLASELEEHSKEARELSSKLMEKESLVREYRNREEMLKNTTISVQNIANKIKKDAEKEAEFILEDAKQKAEIIVKNARTSLKKAHQDLSDLKRVHIQLKNNLKSVLQSHQDLLDQIPASHSTASTTTTENTENTEEALIERKMVASLNQAVQAKDYL